LKLGQLLTRLKNDGIDRAVNDGKLEYKFRWRAQHRIHFRKQAVELFYSKRADRGAGKKTDAILDFNNAQQREALKADVQNSIPTASFTVSISSFLVHMMRILSSYTLTGN
jgi:hypothetical protein